jgi:Double-GTPase 1
MSAGSVVMVGLPDSGKTNYLAALWDALQSGKGRLSAPVPPDEISYVEEALACQSRGEFAPRSDKNIEESRRNFSVAVRLKSQPDAPTNDIVVPDITGELWKGAVETTEIASEWMTELEGAAGAVLFVRILSESNSAPLDWVTTDRLLTLTELSDADEKMSKGMPTQIALCELLRFLEHTLPSRGEDVKPRVALAVTAWDLMDAETSAKGAKAFLRKEYPLFAGRLDDIESLDVAIFGVSAVGGDFDDPDFKERYLKGEVTGYVVTGGGKALAVETDVTTPIAWVLGDEPSP